MSDFWSTVGIFMAGYVMGALFSALAGAAYDARRIIEDAKAKEADE